MPDLPPTQLAYPPKPEGTGWRDRAKTPPKDMTQAVDAVLFNGNTRTAPAEELEWDESPAGVAWWRFAQ
jgi:hypothetical protein